MSKLFGNYRLRGRHVVGWAFEIDHPGLMVRLVHNGKILYQGRTNIPRPEVSNKFKDSRPTGFRLEVDKDFSQEDLQASRVEVLLSERWLQLGETEPLKPRDRPYQTFSSLGASDSQAKLDALRLDVLPNRVRQGPVLQGKSVLDIGCNEGYFCIEAKRLGATRVLGIDKAKKWVELARERSPDIDFQNLSWWEIPDEKFDVIFFLSAIHYEQEQKKLLDKLSSHLKENGVLVLECGIAADNTTERWVPITRGVNDKKKYPTRKLLIDGLLSSFATREIGQSADQSGDPVSRFVFHCQRKLNTAILIAAHGGSGKSVLSKDFTKRGFTTFSTDGFLQRALVDPSILGNELNECLKSEFPNQKKNLGAIGNFIVKEQLADAICKALLEELPIELPYFFVEGELLRHSEVSKNIQSQLVRRGVRVWHIGPQPSAE